jgi:hypothetical protein
MRELHILHVAARIASNRGRMPPQSAVARTLPIFGSAQGPPFPSVAAAIRSCGELLPGALGSIRRTSETSNGSDPLPSFVAPQLSLLRKEAPSGDDWVHELKYDGCRLHARIDRGGVTTLKQRLVAILAAQELGYGAIPFRPL